MSSSFAGASGGGSTGRKNKTRWPEVVGMLAEEAAKVIKKYMPDADIVVMWSDEPASMDLVPDCVRLFVDTVARNPTVSVCPPPSQLVCVCCHDDEWTMEFLSEGGAGTGRPQELVAGGGRDERRGGPEEDPQPEAQRRRRGGAGRQAGGR
ncbi:hypothetical protein C2845_PM13G03110 [Panicum miliaceum]|uniref:Uncharacterized protein n=1 Tax=Panicum miliaceum TaxID=4540 RepID=A0A3L6RJV8_PANMI|nr:hypothetical protein C2845_PM13G03110 [Panicum miliaceum]